MGRNSYLDFDDGFDDDIDDDHVDDGDDDVDDVQAAIQFVLQAYVLRSADPRQPSGQPLSGIYIVAQGHTRQHVLASSLPEATALWRPAGGTSQ